jgi:hypothetical protein
MLLVLTVAAVCGPARYAAGAGSSTDHAAVHALFTNAIPSVSGDRSHDELGSLKLQRDTLGPLVAAARPGLQGMRPNQGKGLALRRSFTPHAALALGAGMGAYSGGPDVRFTLALQYGF